MAKWKAYIQLNGYEKSVFSDYEFEITEAMLEDINKAIIDGVALKECAFYKELYKIAVEAVDFTEFVELSEEEPVASDYDDEEDYLEAKAEYDESLEKVYDEYGIEEIIIYDPGELERFKQKFIGRTFPQMVSEEECWEDYEFDEDSIDATRLAKYSVTVEFDKNGTIVDIPTIDCSGLEFDSFRSSSWATAQPNYEILEKFLNEELTN